MNIYLKHCQDCDLKFYWKALKACDQLKLFTASKKYRNFRKKALDTDWYYLVFRGNVLLGAVWVDHFETERCARLHFSVLPAARRRIFEAAYASLDFLFDHFDTLIIWLPAGNRGAVALARRLGVNVMGMIPNAANSYEGAVMAEIGYLTKGQYYEFREYRSNSKARKTSSKTFTG